MFSKCLENRLTEYFPISLFSACICARCPSYLNSAVNGKSPTRPYTSSKDRMGDPRVGCKGTPKAPLNGIPSDVNFRARTYSKEYSFSKAIKAYFENRRNDMVIVRVPYVDFLQ